MHESGEPLQSVLHMYRSHDSQPMGGVAAIPLSRAEARRVPSCMATQALRHHAHAARGWKDIIAARLRLALRARAEAPRPEGSFGFGQEHRRWR